MIWSKSILNTSTQALLAVTPSYFHYWCIFFLFLKKKKKITPIHLKSKNANKIFSHVQFGKDLRNGQNPGLMSTHAGTVLGVYISTLFPGASLAMCIKMRNANPFDPDSSHRSEKMYA